MTFDDFYDRLTLLIGNEKPYTWAKRIGLKSTLANIDRYKHVPRRDTVLKIAAAAGCDYTWLITGEGTPFRH